MPKEGRPPCFAGRGYRWWRWRRRACCPVGATSTLPPARLSRRQRRRVRAGRRDRWRGRGDRAGREVRAWNGHSGSEHSDRSTGGHWFILFLRGTRHGKLETTQSMREQVFVRLGDRCCRTRFSRSASAFASSRHCFLNPSRPLRHRRRDRSRWVVRRSSPTARGSQRFEGYPGGLRAGHDREKRMAPLACLHPAGGRDRRRRDGRCRSPSINRSIPAGTLAAGVPAKVLRKGHRSSGRDGIRSKRSNGRLRDRNLRRDVWASMEDQWREGGELVVR